MARTSLYPHLDTLVDLRVVDDSLHHPHRRESCVRPIRPTRQHEDGTNKHVCPQGSLLTRVSGHDVVCTPISRSSAHQRRRDMEVWDTEVDMEVGALATANRR